MIFGNRSAHSNRKIIIMINYTELEKVNEIKFQQ